MRKIITSSVLILLFSFFSSTAFAKPVDGICDALKADGVTKGLFGLCVAFHSSTGDRTKIREKYEEKMVPGDPPLPMEGECACWSAMQLADDIALHGDKAPFCFDNGNGYVLFMGPVVYNAEYLPFDPEVLPGCAYASYGTGTYQESPETVEQCITDITVIAATQLGVSCDGF